MKVLVTGGSGYLGQFVVKKLASDHEVLIYRYTFVEAYVSDEHFATFASVAPHTTLLSR